MVAATYCQDFPDLVFRHPDSCALSYHCRQTSTRGSLGRYEAECPHPQLFHLDTLTCVTRPAADLSAFCGSRPLPAASCTSWLRLLVLVLVSLLSCFRLWH